jgi:hypothetical protein
MLPDQSVALNFGAASRGAVVSRLTEQPPIAPEQCTYCENTTRSLGEHGNCAMDAELLRELQGRGRFFYERFPGAAASDEWKRIREKAE